MASTIQSDPTPRFQGRSAAAEGGALSHLVRSSPGFRLFCRVRGERALWPLGGILILAVLYYGLVVVVAVPCSRDTTIPEGSVVYSIQACAEGGALYRDYGQPPYATTPYTPLYYLLVALPVRLCGTSDSVQTAYWSGRILTVLCCVLSLVLVARLARLQGPPRSWALAAALLAVTSRCLVPFGVSCRPDFLALVLTLLGLCVFLRRPTVIGTLLASACFVAAFFAKQSFVAGSLAVLLGCLLHRSWKLAGMLLFCQLAGIVGLSVTANVWTNGLYYANIVEANVAPLRWSQPVTFLTAYYLGNGGLILLFAVAALTRPPRRWRVRRLVPVLYAGTSLSLAVAASTKSGASINYFIEPIFAAAILAGGGLARLAALLRRRPSWRPGFILLTVVLSLGVLAGFGYPSPETDALFVPSPPIVRRLARVRGDILFGDAGLALRSERPVLLLDKFNCSYLSDAGRLDLAELVGRLQRREIAAVLLEHPSPFEMGGEQAWWPREVALAIAEHYRFEEQIEDQYLFVPVAAHGVPLKQMQQ